MTYNDKQFERLAQFDENFFFAVRTKTSGASAHKITMADIQDIAAIHREATGSRIRPQTSCASCVVRVLRVVAAYYFADKDERAAAADAPRKVAKSAATAKPRKRTVKTSKAQDNGDN